MMMMMMMMMMMILLFFKLTNEQEKENNVQKEKCWQGHVAGLKFATYSSNFTHMEVFY